MDSVQKVVAEQMKTVPPHKRNAIILVATDVGFNGAIMKRSADGSLTVVGYIAKNWGEGVTGGGEVQMSW